MFMLCEPSSLDQHLPLGGGGGIFGSICGEIGAGEGVTVYKIPTQGPQGQKTVLCGGNVTVR